MVTSIFYLTYDDVEKTYLLQKAINSKWVTWISWRNEVNSKALLKAAIMKEINDILADKGVLGV